ncbi:MAG TPA: molybdenum cofactor guanylyltransferase, partial [Fimbriiglobus sp.]|nr:molybdenum cofactor guanylyltransferase [Fimbriiglobus sp.]
MTGGIVLCGGRSSRMGRPKAWLPFGDELMLQRVVRVLREVVEPVVVVAALGQDVPPLLAGVEIVRDEVEGRGPLQGLAAGLAALQGKVDAAYLSSCDAPFLLPEFVRRMASLLEEPLPPTPSPLRGGGAEVTPPRFVEGPGEGLPSITVPKVGDYHHPLAAVYRVSVLPVARDLLASDRLRPVFLFDAVPTRVVEPHE